MKKSSLILITLLSLSLVGCSQGKKEDITITEASTEIEESTVISTEKITISNTDMSTENITQEDITQEETVYSELVTEVGRVVGVSGKDYVIEILEEDEVDKTYTVINTIAANVSNKTIKADNGITTGDMVVISYDRFEDEYDIQTDEIPITTVDTVYALMKVEDPIIETETLTEEEDSGEDLVDNENYGESMDEAIDGESVTESRLSDFIVIDTYIKELRPNGLVVNFENEDYFIDTIKLGIDSGDYEVGMTLVVEHTGLIEDGNPKELSGVLNVYQ